MLLEKSWGLGNSVREKESEARMCCGWGLMPDVHSPILEDSRTKGAVKIEIDAMHGSYMLYASRLSLLSLTFLYSLFICANSQLRSRLNLVTLTFKHNYQHSSCLCLSRLAIHQMRFSLRQIILQEAAKV